jgi:polysaccharide export outer membrane protein
MRNKRRQYLMTALGLVWASVAACCGCHSPQILPPPDTTLGRELSKTSLPPYVIEPPDILAVEAIRVVPLPPYKINALDLLYVEAANLPGEVPPINGIVSVDTEGLISLGPVIGPVHVLGLTLGDARKAVEDRLRQRYKDAQATVSLVQSGGLQQIRGEHLVRQDGIITLGIYGSVYVTGMTLPDAKKAIQEHLEHYLLKPEISVDVLAYNSKVCYVVTDGGGYGEQMVRLPITGNETVLDVIAQIGGLPQQSSKRHIWVARPAPAGKGCRDGDQILPVDWNSIVMCGRPDTNWQVMPGDRIFVKADSLIALDNWIGKITAPMERLFGVTLLGNSTVRSFAAPANNSNGNGGGGGGF